MWLILRFIFRFLGKFFRFFFKFGGFLPVGIFIITEFIINLFRANFVYAFSQLAKTLLGAELVINEMVKLAIVDSPKYTFISFLRILVSIYIFYNLIRFIGKLLVKIAGSQALWGAYLMAIFFVAIIEVSAVAVIDKSWGFIPLKDGIIFLLINIKPVIFNVFSSSVSVVSNSSVVNTSINYSKSFFIGFSLNFGRKDI